MKKLPCSRVSREAATQEKQTLLAPSSHAWVLVTKNLSVLAGGLRVPRVGNYISAADFFKDLCVFNKDQPGFTFRKFAQDFSWPISYLGDLAGHRKPLTISRALEFSTICGWNIYETERLVAIALAGSDNGKLHQFFSDKLNSDLDRRSLRQLLPFDNAVGDHIESGAILLAGVIGWRSLPLSLKEARDHFIQLASRLKFEFATNNGFDSELKKLISLGIIKLKGAEIVAYNNKVVYDWGLSSFSEIMHKMLMVRELELKERKENRLKVRYRTALTELPQEVVEELKERINGLANWVRSTSLKNKEKKGSQANVLVKYDLFCSVLADDRGSSLCR
jgi:hypothetical protein